MTRTLGIKSLILLLVCGTKKIHSFATPNCSSGTSRKRNISSGFPTCANGQRSESRGTAFLTDANGVEKCSNRLRSASFLKMIDGDMENVTTKSVDEFDLEKVKVQLKAFWEMALPYFEESKNGRWLFAGMIGMTLLNSGVSVTFSYVLRDFWSALSAKDAELFQSIILKFGAALVVAVPVSTYYRFQREKLAVEWREWMTDRTLQLYYSNRVYYSLERGSEIDNPDQRIAEDVRSFTAFSLSLFISVATSVIDLASFSTILYSIQPQLFGVIVGYALFGTVTTTALGRKLVGLNYEKLQKEADFRYSLVRIRENAESIAFYSGEDIEGKEVSKRLKKVIDNKKDINVAQRNLDYFTTAYHYLIQVLPVSVVAPQYFAGNIALGVVSQSSGAFNHILNDLSIIVNQFESLSVFSAGIDRLSSFMKNMRELDMGRPIDSELMKLPNATSASEDELVSIEKNIAVTNIELIEMPPVSHINSAATNILSVMNLSLSTPDRKRSLIKNLDLLLPAGENLLIVGNSGAGKSSLLRAVAGLWTAGEGTIERPANEEVYFLPQRPYCSIGSLKDQLLYPNLENFDTNDYPEGHIFSRSHIMKQALSDEGLLEILESIDLGELPYRAGDGDPIKGLETVLDWSNMLSLGEQQRLAFGRLLVNRPRLAILDEATSALDMEAEARMYKLLAEMGRNGEDSLTYISVGHRPSLLNYHDKRLRLNGEKEHILEAVDRSLLSSVPAKNM
mmetsp:Transcript_21173/g.31589  ORF Transcript_21173/g.31589 Transcript_21173/m.31589 type:complete len:736 (-) Transcript_21173:310-2517(-)|eukprot:CAMPEP_0116017964 /NCGR_PEP_ID=MMETSP0321-20121206/8370_1 /TAXON_ID=163516 /ORGANISM="Leptocylindrus danicus var. danicus, Strain B650" /LENGTH=735 /DNA_ID=CAMNT_0003488275 /DNA_START=68 /DNA_END=2275 /DNA_ORIENTATION=+